MSMTELFRHVKRDSKRDADDWRSAYADRKRARLTEEVDGVKNGQTLTTDVDKLTQVNINHRFIVFGGTGKVPYLPSRTMLPKALM